MSAGKSDAQPTRDDRVLEITRVFAAPRRLVFETWTRPEHLKHWSAPTGFTIPICEGDVRVGGKWRCCMVSPAGVEHWLGGVYREIERDKRLVFTFTWENEGPSAGIETVVTITFEGRDGRTVQTFHQSPFRNVERRDSHIGGWNQAFDKEEAYARDVAREHAA